MRQIHQKVQFLKINVCLPSSEPCCFIATTPMSPKFADNCRLKLSSHTLQILVNKDQCCGLSEFKTNWRKDILLAKDKNVYL